MKNFRSLLLVAGALCLASHGFAQKVSELGFTNTLTSNALFSVAAKLGLGYGTRAVSFGALSNAVAAGAVAGATAAGATAGTNAALGAVGSSLTDGSNNAARLYRIGPVGTVTHYGTLTNFLTTCLTANRPIKILFGGDSIGADCAGDTVRLFERFHTGGKPRGGFAHGFPDYYSSAPSFYGAATDVYWGATGSGGQGYTLTNTASMTWGGASGGGYVTGDSIQYLFHSDPTNGTATIETTANGTDFTTVAVVDQSGSRALNVTNISVTRAAIGARVTSTGDTMHFWLSILDSQTKAARVSVVNVSGRYLKDFKDMGTANLATLLTNLSPDLIVWQQLKEAYDRTNWPSVKTIFTTYAPNASVCLISGHWISPANEPAAAANTVSNLVALDRSISISNRWGFVDVWSGQNWSNTVANGFSSDGTHFSATGQAWEFSEFANAVNLPVLITANNLTLSTNQIPSINPLANTTNRGVFWCNDTNQAGATGARIASAGVNTSGLWLGVHWPGSGGQNQPGITNWALVGAWSAGITTTYMRGQGGIYFMGSAADPNYYGYMHPGGCWNFGSINNGYTIQDRGSGTVDIGKGLLIRSNTVSTPLLNIGDTWYWSSNGIPHVTYRVAAGTNIIRLVP